MEEITVTTKSNSTVTTVLQFEDPCQKFSKWLLTSKPGDKYCYYEGDHVAGKAVGGLAFRAYERKEVILFQKKLPNKYVYIAQKRDKWRR